VALLGVCAVYLSIYELAIAPTHTVASQLVQDLQTWYSSHSAAGHLA
jgi:hypothetical protein